MKAKFSLGILIMFVCNSLFQFIENKRTQIHIYLLDQLRAVHTNHHNDVSIHTDEDSFCKQRRRAHFRDSISAKMTFLACNLMAA